MSEMKSNYNSYNYLSSFDRLDEILDAKDAQFEEERDSVPSRENLTFTNGFYVKCAALCIDIRGSSQLANQHRRPTLAKIYRAYLSEAVAVMNGSSKCTEINIVGDGVTGIFNTPYQIDIDEVFAVAYQLNSMIKTFNCKLRKRNITTIKVGIGMSYGRALMIKAGYKGSGINEVVWMGDVVNTATKLANKANKDIPYPVVVSEVFYSNLNEHNQSLLHHSQPFYSPSLFAGHVIATQMEEWYEENCVDTSSFPGW